MAWTTREFDEKVARVRSLMQTAGLNQLLLSTATNIFWLTGGRPYVNSVAEKACADILITADAVYLVANNIEAGRLLTEELAGLPLVSAAYNWWEPEGQSKVLRELSHGEPVKSEADLGSTLAALRWMLTVEEQNRFRQVGQCAGAVMEKMAFAVEPGQSEQQIAQLMRQTALAAGLEANVALVAADERAYQYRHPLPTDKKVANYVMLVMSGQQQGLYASISRLVHFGKVPADLRRRADAVNKVDAAFIAATRPGAQVKEAFAAGLQAYAAVGFPEQWQFHHQGGMAGYNSREFRATAQCEVLIEAGQAYAWNPTIAGAKAEDTILIGAKGNTILTATPGLPVQEVEVAGLTLHRPDFVVR